MPILNKIIKKGIELSRYLKSEEFENPAFVQEAELRHLLEKAEFTMFGETFGFTKILKEKDLISAFKTKVPIYDYTTIFSEWWNKSLHERDVCWPGQVKYFALSSGTSDSSSKHIPVTKAMSKSIRKQGVRQILSLRNYNFPETFFNKRILMLGGSTHLSNNGHYFEGDLSGITASKIPFWFQHFYKPGKKIAKESNWEAKLEEIAENAPSWDIGVIVGVPSWILLLLEKIISKYNLKSIHDIWPNLALYVHGGVSFEPYRNSFEKLLIRPLVYIETYLASEGFIAMQESPGEQMKLNLDNGLFFEFIPFNNKNFSPDGEITLHPETLCINEVIECEEYALVISSNAGAWRYLIGDVIKFVNKENAEIAITGRTKHYISLCGEHLSVDNMNKAIEMVGRELDVSLPEFTVAGIPEGNMFAHHWWVGTDHNIDPLLLKNLLDEKLKIINDDYRVERSAALKEIYLDVLPVHVFYDWLAKKGKLGSQNKFPRVLKNAVQEDWSSHVEEFTGILSKV